MKLIINISEERYKQIIDEQWLPNRLKIEKAIANGIPLNELKAEIEKEYQGYYNIPFKDDFEDGVCQGLYEALMVVNKYMGE